MASKRQQRTFRSLVRNTLDTLLNKSYTQQPMNSISATKEPKVSKMIAVLTCSNLAELGIDEAIEDHNSERDTRSEITTRIGFGS